MLLTKEQISEQMCKHAQKKNGLHDLMEIMLESMMLAERSEFLIDNPSNKGNGYRPGSTYGHGRKLEFRIPRDRYGNFHPQILAILRDQEEECDRLAGMVIALAFRLNTYEASRIREKGLESLCQQKENGLYLLLTSDNTKVKMVKMVN